MEPFLVDLKALSERSEQRTSADAERIFERIFKGPMPALISGQNSNGQIFYSSYLPTYVERDIRESNNMLKRQVNTPKLYFYDTGLVCYLTKWSSPETLESGAMNGAILENYVVSEIRKTYLNCGKE